MERDIKMVEEGHESEPQTSSENIIIFIYEFLGTLILMSTIGASVASRNFHLSDLIPRAF